MKNVYSRLFYACITIFLISCSTSDDEATDNTTLAKGSLQIEGGVVQDLRSAVLEPYEDEPEENGLYNNYLKFFTTELKQENGNIIPEDFDFSMITFQIVSSSFADVSVGSYNQNDEPYTDPRIFTYFGSGFIIRSDDASSNSETLKSGTLHVSKDEGDYVFSFEGITTTGKNFSFEYKGDLILE